MADATVIHVEWPDGRRAATTYGQFKKHWDDIFKGAKITGDADDLPFEEPKAPTAAPEAK